MGLCVASVDSLDKIPHGSRVFAFFWVGVILYFSFSSLFLKAAKSNRILVGFCIHVAHVVDPVLSFEIQLRKLALSSASRNTV
jgi:hypothetical protein